MAARVTNDSILLCHQLISSSSIEPNQKALWPGGMAKCMGHSHLDYLATDPHPANNASHCPCGPPGTAWICRPQLLVVDTEKLHRAFNIANQELATSQSSHHAERVPLTSLCAKDYPYC